MRTESARTQDTRTRRAARRFPRPVGAGRLLPAAPRARPLAAPIGEGPFRPKDAAAVRSGSGPDGAPEQARWRRALRVVGIRCVFRYVSQPPRAVVRLPTG